MGRKIPGRKHRGVKDPEQQAVLRLNSIKDKINAPPANPDIQEVSKTLQKIIDLKNKAKTDPPIKKKKVKAVEEPNEKGVKSKKKNIDPRFQQLPNETEKAFLNRINKICMTVTKEAAFEEKYGVEINRDAAGEVKIVKRSKDELEVLLKKVRKEQTAKKTKKKKKEDENDTPRLTKSQKWQKKKNEKKLKKKLNSADDSQPLTDTVKFGEIVHAPPTLTVPKKVQKITPRPGQKKLLLSAIIQANTTEKEPKKPGTKPKEQLQKVTKKTIDKKGKRKDLPNAVRRQLDTQQQEVISAYKLLKTRKHASI